MQSHEQTAHDILGLLIHDDAACNQALFEYNLRINHFPDGRTQRLCAAVMKLRSDGRAGSLSENLLAEATGDNMESVVQISGLGLDASGQIDALLQLRLGENIHMLQKHAELIAVRNALEKAHGALTTPAALNGAVETLMTNLTGLGQQITIERHRAFERGEDFNRYMQSAAPVAVETGIKWVDDLTGGFYAERLWVLLGAYKSRKTTMALNMVLGALEREPNVNIGFLSREQSWEQIVAAFVAMLAVRWLMERNLDTKFDKGGYPLGYISAELLLQARNSYKRWHPHKAQAVDAAIRHFTDYGKRLRIYDSNVKHGGLSDMHSAARVLKRDIALEGGDVFFFDYAGLFDVEGNEYEQAKTRAFLFQSWMVTHKKPLVVVAQRNEESIKGNMENSYSAGAKGGGDLPAAANYLFVTQYKTQKYPDETDFRLTLKLSRHSSTGAETLKIHPASGLLEDVTWVKRGTA
jgi:hypothetical protein